MYAKVKDCARCKENLRIRGTLRWRACKEHKTEVEKVLRQFKEGVENE